MISKGLGVQNIWEQRSGLWRSCIYSPNPWLIDHPHLHCLATGGGLSLDGKRWLRSKKDFFIPVKVLSCLFRGKFLDGLKREYEAGELRFPGQIEGLKEASTFKRFLTDLYHQPWVVYCKPPLKHPEKVVDYLGRYTHRVALSNDRLVKMEDNRVTFRWRDSADNNTIRPNCLIRIL